MRIMAIDYGDARTGMAVSDATGTLTGDAWVIKERNLSKVVNAAAQEAAAREVSVIVVGHPKNMDGSVGPRAEKSKELAEAMKLQTGIETVLWDERLTTMNAHRILSDTGTYGKKRKNTVDAVAASLILESYLAYIQK
ncbi:MAG: Holliday junction resolvase RuvX [Oscillospiraceae bacterium]|nr:Holliday junction resolvase RuvX [Oscillospiraceae bacterium]